MSMYRDWFVNPRHNPACPAGDVSFWKTRQGGGNVVDNIASTEGMIMSLDSANARHEEVTTGTQKNSRL